MKRLVVLAAGHGSNLQAILNACAAGAIAAQVTAVISHNPGAYALIRAQDAQVPAIYKPRRPTQTRREYDAELAGLVQTFTPDWVVLAGWLRVLSSDFLQHFPERVINLHPALPGAFPGLHAIERAFEAYQHGAVAGTGVMVHRVPDEGVDTGPVLAQEDVPILPTDDLAALEARIHTVEHRLLIKVLQDLCGGAPA